MGSRTQGVYGDLLASAFGLSRAPTIVSRALHKSTLAVTELRGDLPNFGLTAPLPREDAYLVALQLRACHDHDLYFDGRLVRPRSRRPSPRILHERFAFRPLGSRGS